MKIIYVGFPKTGTKSLSAAFEILGYKCIDFDENFRVNGDKWYRILNGQEQFPDFKEMLKDYDVAVDTPVYMYWEEILSAFPDAKIIICIREEKKWIKSWMNQVERIVEDKHLKILSMLSPTAQKFLKYNRILTRVIYAGFDSVVPWRMCTGITADIMLKKYRQHNLYVTQTVAPDKLLVLEMGHGWEPICKFLGKPIPDEPYLHINKDGSVFEDYMQTSPVFIQMKREGYISCAVMFAVLSAIVFLFCRFY